MNLPLLNRFTRPLVVVLTLLFLAPLARGQEVPFAAVVVENEVVIHSGAGRAYYSVGTLKKGDVVQVEEVFHHWHKIVPPKGVYSYISKGFVNAQGDGSKGVVNRDRAEVKAANVRGPAQSYRGQTELSEGDTVTIVGEEGSFYKITPPANAYVYLEPTAVQRATEIGGATEPVKPVDMTDTTKPTEPVKPTEPREPAEPTEPTEPTDPAEPADPVKPVDPIDPGDPMDPVKPVEPVDPTDPAGPADPVDPIPPADPAEPIGPIEEPGDGDMTKGGDVVAVPDMASADVRTLDAKMVPLFSLPLEEQPLDQMRAAYQKFEGDESLSTSDRRVIRLRLAAIAHNQKVLSAIQQSDATLASLQEQRAELEKIDANTFDAVGILRASSVYDGKKMPLMYRLVDPTTQRTKAYVTANRTVDPSGMLGQLVGVKGVGTLDRATNLTVIEPSRITPLEVSNP